jgi:hypothetical protein
MQYHLKSMQRSQDFLVCTSTIREQNNVLSLINHRNKEESQRNAAALESIISILHLCACQNIPLRSHRCEIKFPPTIKFPSTHEFFLKIYSPPTKYFMKFTPHL